MDGQIAGVCNSRKDRNIQGWSPGVDFRNKLFMTCIRPLILDALWSRESATVRTNRGKFNKVMGLSEMLRVRIPIQREVPTPEDSFGMKVA
jgi:hypothetical protein